jgi:predicted dehydrogenase
MIVTSWWRGCCPLTHSAVDKAKEIGLPEGRGYGSVAQMLAAEGSRPDGVEVVAIMTPNDGHFPFAMAALEHSLHVICDKPMTNRVDEARLLHAKVVESGRIFCLTHNYTGYPMVRQARAMVAGGNWARSVWCRLNMSRATVPTPVVPIP